MDNVVYRTDQIARYFAQNRITWEQFYESERVIIDALGLEPARRILDIGCGCGGLGLMLRDRYGIGDYTGVEINATAADTARRMNSRAEIHCGDILDVSKRPLRDERFDVVFSLSCVDWNVRFADMLATAWGHVAPGGQFVATFRLTLDQGCSDITRSYQFVNYYGNMEGERASYVVLNARSLIETLAVFDPSDVAAYGYWGAPSATAVTPYTTLCFAAFSIRKRAPADTGAIRYQLRLPDDVIGVIDRSSR